MKFCAGNTSSVQIYSRDTQASDPLVPRSHLDDMVVLARSSFAWSSECSWSSCSLAERFRDGLTFAEDAALSLMFDTASLFCAAFRMSPVGPHKPAGLGQRFVPGDLWDFVGLWPTIRAARGYSTFLFGSLNYSKFRVGSIPVSPQSYTLPI
jgi:hypothetical protein